MSVLLTRDEGRVRVLTLNRPAALNAFNDALYNAVAVALTSAAADDSVSVVVLTAEGRAFSAGQDLAELDDGRAHEQRQLDGFRPFMDALGTFPKPIIAAVNGLGIGIGCTLLPYCDLVLMSREAQLRAPFVGLGLTEEAGSSYLLPSIIGWQTTAQFLFTGEWMSADMAHKAGLARSVFEAPQLMIEAMALATQIAQAPVVSLVATKQLLVASRMDAIRAARTREDIAFAKLVGGPANRTAIDAMKKK